MLIITGSLAYDYIMDFPESFADHILPDQIHKLNLSFVVKTFAKRRGGTAGNTSYSLSLLDAKHVLFGIAGRDFEEYQKDFARFGIDITHVTIDQTTYTSTAFGMTDKNNNQIWGFFPGAMENIGSLRIDKVATKNDLVLIGTGLAKGAVQLTKQLIKAQIPYLFDPGWILTEVSNDDLAEGILHAKMLIGNDYEITLIKNRLPSYQELVQDKIVITTLGKQGAMILNGKETLLIKAAIPKKVIDPSGAGDAWRGGFLAGFARGFDLQTCGQMGSVVASFAIEQYGAQEYTFTKNEFIKRYKDTYNDFSFPSMMV